MSYVTPLSNQRLNNLWIPFISALLIVLFLAFIDEGYYDFRWMTDAGSWVAFGVYTAIFFGIQALIYNFALRGLKGVMKNLIMLGVITPAIMMMILGLV
jgi:hypothetical protein